MIITRISTPKRQSNRRQIYLDGDFTFTCHVNVVARFRLREGMMLTAEHVLAIQQGQVRQECFDKAMEPLQRRLHSRAELFKKLTRHEYGEALINSVLDQLTQLGYLNDEEFARTRAQSAARHKQHGRRRAFAELIKAGIGSDVAARAVDDVYFRADITLARQFVQKQIPRLRKLDPEVARRRLTGMLLRPGLRFRRHQTNRGKRPRRRPGGSRPAGLTSEPFGAHPFIPTIECPPELITQRSGLIHGAPGDVAQIVESDIPDVADFLARQVRPGEAVGAHPLPPVDRLRWLLLQNPARADGIPFGWCIRDSLRSVVGAALCVPFRIGAKGAVFSALMFCKFFVDPAYRGMGLGLLMRFVAEGERFPLFVTSTNAIAGQLFERIGASLIPGMDHTMLGIASPRPVMEEWLFRRFGQAMLARVLSFPAGLARGWKLGDTGKASKEKHGAPRLTLLPNADAAADVVLSAPDQALAVIRDRGYLHWRYFTGEMDKQVYSLRIPDEPDRLIVVNLVRSGHRGQIRVLNVLDVWPPTTSATAPALAAALADEYRGQFDTIWMRSQPASAELGLRNCGFIRHAFPAPLGWYIDRKKRLPTHDWYLMPGESE